VVYLIQISHTFSHLTHKPYFMISFSMHLTDVLATLKR